MMCYGEKMIEDSKNFFLNSICAVTPSLTHGGDPLDTGKIGTHESLLSLTLAPLLDLN